MRELGLGSDLLCAGDGSGDDIDSDSLIEFLAVINQTNSLYKCANQTLEELSMRRDVYEEKRIQRKHQRYIKILQNLQMKCMEFSYF